MKQLKLVLACTLLVATLLGVSVLHAAAQDSLPIVRVVLFYSPSCPHCEYVIKEVLPPLTDKYGAQLQILGFDVTQTKGAAMFYSALDRYGIQQAGVPLLVIDNVTLVGSDEIPNKLPALIESYMKLGGAAWPDIPGLREMLIAAAQTATAEAAGSSETSSTIATPAAFQNNVQPERQDWQQRFLADAAANSIAVAVLVAMLATMIWSLMRFRRASGPRLMDRPLTWLIPVLCLAGLVVASYLAYIEAAGTSAVCGPIGDCNAVQQSPYSHLFGVLSIGAFGLVGFLLILTVWAAARFGRTPIAARATVLMFGLALLGTLFSSYLTFLEPFLIGASCAWCLSSAMIMAALAVLTAGAAGLAWRSSQPGPVPPPSSKSRPARLRERARGPRSAPR